MRAAFEPGLGQAGSSAAVAKHPADAVKHLLPPARLGDAHHVVVAVGVSVRDAGLCTENGCSAGGWSEVAVVMGSGGWDAGGRSRGWQKRRWGRD